jgi:hypothetical protein
MQTAAQTVVVSAGSVWVDVDTVDPHSRRTQETLLNRYLVGGHLVLNHLASMRNI